jgi:hypothetical protein
MNIQTSGEVETPQTNISRPSQDLEDSANPALNGMFQLWEQAMDTPAVAPDLVVAQETLDITQLHTSTPLEYIDDIATLILDDTIRLHKKEEDNAKRVNASQEARQAYWETTDPVGVGNREKFAINIVQEALIIAIEARKHGHDRPLTRTSLVIAPTNITLTTSESNLAHQTVREIDPATAEGRTRLGLFAAELETALALHSLGHYILPNALPVRTITPQIDDIPQRHEGLAA